MSSRVDDSQRLAASLCAVLSPLAALLVWHFWGVSLHKSLELVGTLLISLSALFHLRGRFHDPIYNPWDRLLIRVFRRLIASDLRVAAFDLQIGTFLLAIGVMID